MGLLGLFKLRTFDPAEFEKELTTITQAISQNKNQIAQLIKKKKALRKRILAYGFAIYLLYVAYIYKSSIDNLGVFSARMSKASIFLHGQLSQVLAGVLSAPFAISFVVYSINCLFDALILSKSNSLKNLQKKHKEKLEELKKVTNFSKTNQLLQKFDGDLSDLNLPDGKPQAKQTPKRVEGNNQEEFDDTALVNGQKSPLTMADNKQGRAHGIAGSRLKGNALRAQNKNPLVDTNVNKRSFQDRILDLIIGSDHNESVEQRYALICANCYTHNGLAPPGCTNPNNVTYICRHCGFINGQLHLSSPVESTKSDSPPVGKVGNADLADKAQEIGKTS